jgi:cytochrome c oxidase subunit 2
MTITIQFGTLEEQENSMHRRLTVFLVAVSSAILLSACSASKQFDPIPAGLDTTKVPHETVEMTAEHFHFTPEELHVKEGTLLTLKIRSIDGTHGFSLGDFGIDMELVEGVTNTIELYLPKKGEYGFRCSHFCGLGHLGMTGTLHVE